MSTSPPNRLAPPRQRRHATRDGRERCALGCLRRRRPRRPTKHRTVKRALGVCLERTLVANEGQHDRSIVSSRPPSGTCSAKSTSPQKRQTWLCSVLAQVPSAEGLGRLWKRKPAQHDRQQNRQGPQGRPCNTNARTEACGWASKIASTENNTGVAIVNRMRPTRSRCTSILLARGLVCGEGSNMLRPWPRLMPCKLYAQTFDPGWTQLDAQPRG